MFTGRDVVAAEMGEVVDLVVSGEKALRPPGRIRVNTERHPIRVRYLRDGGILRPAVTDDKTALRQLLGGL
jgi:hypothetical protein